MKTLVQIITSICLLFILSSCKQSDKYLSNNHKNPSTIRLSNEGIVPEQENTVDDENEVIVELDIPHDVGFGVPFKAPSEQNELKQKVETRAKRLEETTQISLEELKDKWNRISIERNVNLAMTTLEKVSSKNETYYKAVLPNQLELNIFTTNDKVTRIDMVASPKNSSETFMMLTGWSQMYFLFDPDYNENHVDMLLAKLGVGPNSDLKKISNHTILHDSILYKIKKINNQYFFRATYLKR